LRAVAAMTGMTLVLLMGAYVSPALARVVRMETSVNLTDRSDPSVKQALKEAFDTSMRGAVAMGFTRIRVDGFQVRHDTVVLATVATDEDDDDDTSDNTRVQ
jgi:Na+/H+-translocating membrane pyrophosphatase